MRHFCQTRRHKSKRGRQFGGLVKPSDAILIPPVSEIKALARTTLSSLAKENPDFGKVMRLLIPRIVVFPVRLCVGGMIVLRARFRLRASNLLPDQRVRQALQQPLERVLTAICSTRRSRKPSAPAFASCGPAG